MTPDQDLLGAWSFLYILLKQIWISTTFFTAISTVVTVVNSFYHDILSVQSSPVTLIGTLVSFMLTVKVSNDQSTWKDSRAEWSNIAANSRQLATLIWHNAKVDTSTQTPKPNVPKDQSPQALKDTCMRLLEVFPVATRYGLEGQGTLAREDDKIIHLNAALPREKPPILRAEFTDPSEHALDSSPNEIPRDILTTLSACIATLAQQGSLPESLLPTLETSLFSLQTSLSALTRASTSQPPRTATLQTRLSVYAYLFFLPFQLNEQLRWWTIPAELVVSLVYLGFMAVGADIGRPFQPGLTKLDLNGLVEDMKRQIQEIAQTQEDRERLRAIVKPHLMRDNSQVPIVPAQSVDSLIDLEAQPTRASSSSTAR